MQAELPPILTEARVREVFREYERLTSPGLLGTVGMLARGLAMLAQKPEDRMAAVAESLSSEPVQALAALGTERQRAEAITKLIALLGVDEARAHATALSARAAAEGQDLFKRAWKYSQWEHVLLHAASVIGGAERPIAPDEVDAVHRALDEILSRDRFLRMAFQNAEATGATLRADPESRTRLAGPKIRDTEARKWLARKKPSMLAANRFGATAAGQEFVAELYAAGATKVVVPGDAVEPDDGDGFAHADALVVHLPKAPAARRRVLAIVNREARREGADEVADTGQKEERLWWD
jgi:hypothetical protein